MGACHSCGFAYSVVEKRKRSTESASPTSSNVDVAKPTRILSIDASSSSSFSGQLGYEYDVFLSFRGGDTRKGFTDSLYTALEGAGIYVFRDNEGLAVGEEIGPELLHGIKHSSISIPIFSENYASSKWCLEEFAFMMECREARKQIVLPVFYDVTPNQVQHQTGSYDSAFRQHAKKQDPDTVQRWRKALAEVGSLKGWELRNETNGYQGKLIGIVVAEVLRELKKAHLCTSKNLVAIDDKVEKVMGMLDVEAPDVRFVGIWGMGGIGKTTLAKVVYNRITDCFDACSFLQDVRETSKCSHNGVRQLQSQLVADILRRGRQDFATVDEGINELRRRFREKKVLILLDDVDHVDQLSALAAEVDWFGRGSRIIITTRNKDVLRAVEEHHVHEVREMEEAQALQLFCKHALRRDDPTIKLRALSEEIVRTTGGLPLALEVIGSFLHGKSEEMWRATSKKLKLVPNKEVKHMLRISYDDLEPRQKQMFLDIACFFTLVFKGDAACIWEDCYGLPPEADIEALQLLSLIKINDKDGFEMHDQLQDLGREIVRSENYKEPGERSRLWGDEAIDVLLNQQGTPKIEAVHIAPKGGVIFSNKCFQNLSRLRILMLYGVGGLAGDYQHLLPELRWLRLWGETVSPPANLALNNLVVLEICFSNINEEWISWSSIKMGKLKVLELMACHRLRRISGFSAFPNLERLILHECTELDSIDPSIERLKNLNFLSLRKCIRLEKLPDQLGYLEGLVELYVDYTPIEEIPISTRMKKLEVLYANYCYHLNRIPESIGSLVNLKELSLVECSSLSELPETIGQLKSLIELDLQSSGITYLPKTLGNLKELHVMNVRGCSSLKGEVPLDIGSLSLLRDLTLYLTKCNRPPASISGLSHLQDLHLYIRRCWNHQTLPELPSNLISLTVEGSLPRVFPARTLQVKLREGAEDLTEESGELDFCGDHMKLKEDCLAKLFKLEKLVLRSVNIEALPEEIGFFSQLKEIEIARCTKLEFLPTLPSNLCLLGVYDCGSLRKFPSLSKLRKLSELYVHNMRLREINGLGDLISLKNLSLHDCPSTMLDGVERLESLRELSITSCDLQRLPQLSNLRRLSRLDASDNRQLVDAQGIDNLPELESIDFSNCTSLERLPDLSKLQRLECLELASCNKLSQLEGLEKLESLQRLNIELCIAIEKLPDLSKLQNLSFLCVMGCEKLRHLEGLGELTSLKKLFTIGCKAKLPNMSKMQNLQVLWIKEFENLCQLDNIKDLGSVEDFTIYGCRTTKLSELSKLQNLQTVIMRCCEKLSRLDSPHKSENPAELDISGCNAIERLSDLSKLKNLWELSMEAWEKPDQIEGLEELESLQNLALSESKSIKELPNLSKLSRLAVLRLKHLENLRRLDMIENLRSLKDLEISWCKAIQKLPQLSNLQNLRYLTITDCEKLSQLDGIQELGLLQELDISWCKAIEMLPELSKLQSLRHMNFIGCEKLIQLDGIGELVSLKQLDISWCRAIEELPEMSKLRGLQRLIMRGCKKMKQLDRIEELGSLEHLDISCCKAIKKLPELSRLSKLVHLNMRGCEKLNRVDEIGGLVSLKQLDISECKAIEELPDLSKLQSLWHLNMRSCRKLRRLDGLEELQSVEELALNLFKSMEKLPDLSKLQRLRWLQVEACEELHKLGLEKLESLEHLAISRCRTIGKLPDLSKLQRLHSLEVKACRNLHQLDRLEELESLWKLDISWSKAIEKLPKLSKNYNLSILYMRGCSKLRQLDGLGELTSLEELDISYCNAIENIPNLAMLQRLRMLKVKACKKLRHLEGIEGLNQLEELDMSGCKAIEQLPDLSQLQRLWDLRMEGSGSATVNY